MRPPVVVDTNVVAVANGDTPHASPACVLACVERLESVQKGETVLVDDSRQILDEYSGQLRPRTQPEAGDIFVFWLHASLGNEECCRQVPITPHEERGFAEFPDDPALRKFDRDDRKFVAVAIASGTRPPIVNASDTDWHEHREALERHGVRVEFVCPELMPGAGSGGPPR